ncbi:MAG: hypothetical protein JSW49_03550 [candidate division WOR-3 bacterium]|nr:MAG: hypothetical protein JSW49_03550 [candidate division WOR-3 bacterium]
MNELDFSEISRLSEKYSKDPQSRIFVQLADVYRKNNMVDEALDVLNKGLAYHPEYPLAYLVLGKCYFDKRSHVQAKDAFEKTISLDPQNVVALRMLARTCEMLKDEKGQINAYKNIIAIDPLDTNAKEKLSMLEALQRKEPLYTVAMAEEYEKQGNIEESLKIYENLLFTDPSDLILKQKVAELKKVIEEKKRVHESEKIGEMKIETVFEPDELKNEGTTEQRASTPATASQAGSEPAPAVEEGIQSLEDFLVEELEQAADKIATQHDEQERVPEKPVPQETPGEDEGVTEPASAKSDGAIPLPSQPSEPAEKPTPAQEPSFGDIKLEEPTPAAVVPGSRIEDQKPPPSDEPEPIAQEPVTQTSEPSTPQTPTEEPVAVLEAPDVKEEKDTGEKTKKPDEEDFKSFQEWLSGLLK